MVESVKPHVLTKEDALRNVDIARDFTSMNELDAFLKSSFLIGVGTNALVWRLPDYPEGLQHDCLIRIEIRNPLGPDWTEKTIESLIEKHPEFYEKLSFLYNKIDTHVRGHSMKSQRRQCKKSTLDQIAGHNSAYRRDPLITMPINSYYTFKTKVLGVRIKYIQGQSLTCVYPEANVSPYALAILKDTNPSNIIINTDNGTESSSLIDICEFTPSDQELDKNSSLFVK